MSNSGARAFDLRLYAVTDRAWLNGGRLEDQVEQALLGGATLVQLREKDLATGAFIEAAERVKRVTDRHQVPLIINDRLDVVLAVDAAGLHIGQDDMPARTARRLLGPDRILGVSVADRDQALQAERDGADYLGAGAVFPTGTKLDASEVDYRQLQRLTAAVAIPVVAIGGINERNALELCGSGIHGIAVVSALFAQPDIRAAARAMRELAERIAGPV
jgi:thiamine-phosphate diphosphorylase